MARTPDDPTKAQVWIDNTDPLNPLFEFYFPKGAKGDPGGIVNPSALGAGYDWNNLIVSGLYYAAGADMASMPNSPPSMAVGVNIMVTARNAAVVTQIAWTTSNAHNQIQFMRSLVSGTWGPWKVIRNTNIDNTAGKAIYLWDETQNRSQLIYGDTGWRQMTLPTEWTTGKFSLRRVGYMVTAQFSLGTPPSAVGESHGYTLSGTGGVPTGFRPFDTVFGAGFGRLGASNKRQPVNFSLNSSGTAIIERNEAAGVDGQTLTTGAACYVTVTYPTSDPWPTVLPGSALGSIPNL
ncbi:hypothetical protein FDH63_gp02 [Arthrobacter phage Wayne]|uniref:Minor tail protein n=1 Tax=Arthrobacter phage Wayne TaxID=1772322 RepID=A0A0U4IYW1_9CAUD|nr:hypothetical protein FDH63_gp02 [Arthrobacter phage Wayne]ALY10727.1 hypothetical protein PBI_WAYNE_2 [Arthrobacter phage Wayne]